MSSKRLEEINFAKGERAFRDAFERLKANEPLKLSKGTSLSQNNVAREAGYDPSALKKSRFPDLVSSIQEWLREHPVSIQPSNHQKLDNQRRKNREAKERVAELASQRDHLSSLLVQADSKILELSRRIAILESLLPDNVVTLPRTGV